MVEPSLGSRRGKSILDAAAARYRKLAGLPEPERQPAPEPRPEPVNGAAIRHELVVGYWFIGECRSWRAAVVRAGYSPSSAARIFARQDVLLEIERHRARIAAVVNAVR